MRTASGWRVASELMLAVALFIGILLEFHRRIDVPVVAAAALVALPSAVRLRWPVLAAAVAAVGFFAFTHTNALTADHLPFTPLTAWGLTLWAVGSRCRPATVVASGLVSFVAWTATVGIAAPVGHMAAGALLIGCALLIGRAMGVLQFESDTYAEEVATLARERDERAELAVREERRRIARELHDVISHSISVMGVQAGAVRTLLRPDQVRESQVLQQIEQTGRETIAEMARLLGLLRDANSAADSPPQGLGRAERLVGQFREAGLNVTLTIDGDLGHLPAGVDLAGFRILQEALTNVLKHAPRAVTCAHVIRSSDHLSIHVVDDGAGREASLTGTGHGLLGMVERASLYEGVVTARPRECGGFEVCAELPLVGPR